MKQTLLILLVLSLTLFTVHNVRAGEISVTDPWIREAPAVAGVLAAYMTISNNSRHTVQIDSASGADFTMIEIHRTMMHEDMAQMVKQSSLRIEAGKSLVLEPGGYHLMLMKPRRPLRAGDKVILQLHFTSGETIDVIAEVRKQ